MILQANDTCSGCNEAKYCGSFCQHKDWEIHHRRCGRTRRPNGNDDATAKSDRRSEDADKASDEAMDTSGFRMERPSTEQKLNIIDENHEGDGREDTLRRNSERHADGNEPLRGNESDIRLVQCRGEIEWKK